MERAIGEVFDFDGVKLRVEREKDEHRCEGCYFSNPKHLGLIDTIQVIGMCNSFIRRDKESVIFVKVEDSKDKEE